MTTNHGGQVRFLAGPPNLETPKASACGQELGLCSEAIGVDCWKDSREKSRDAGEALVLGVVSDGRSTGCKPVASAYGVRFPALPPQSSWGYSTVVMRLPCTQLTGVRFTVPPPCAVTEVANGGVCKTLICQFDSDTALHPSGIAQWQCG